MQESQLFDVIKNVIKDEPLDGSSLNWEALIRVAKRHSLLAYVALYESRLPEQERPAEEIHDLLKQRYAAEQAKAVHQMLAINDISNALEKNEVYHLFLKGSVTRDKYPTPFLRSMGDIDFLYKETQHEVLKETLLASGFDNYREGRKNDTYSRKPYVCVEAHRQLVPSDSSYDDYCERVWERSKIKDGYRFRYEMSAEDELVYNLIHLAIHFLEGGAGVRFILDVYVYNHLSLDKEYVENELQKIDLLDFYHNVSDLAEYWFGSGTSNSIVEDLSAFVLNNGVFGSSENSAALAVKDGRIRFIQKVCFPSYAEMKSMFPWLKGKKLLLPYAWAVRGVRALKNRKGSVQGQFDKASKGNQQKGKSLEKLFNDCGLTGKL